MCLAEFQIEDYKPYYETWKDPITQRNFNSKHERQTFEDFLAFYTNPERPPQRLDATILRLSGDQPIGRISLAPKHLEPDLGIWIYQPFRFQGYGTEAVSLAVEYIFEHFDLEYIVAGIYEHNSASMKLFRKVGFRRTPELDEEEDDVFDSGTITQFGFRIDR